MSNNKDRPIAKPDDPPVCDDPKAEDSNLEDQTKRGYYYDDSHGYKKFDPNQPDENDDDDLP